ncbi:alpha/beta fold hydrolase [Pseudomonas sp. NPDC088368]|jgi:pimeloyl-ACP methyl ester carboxylesterase|uniref:alpha/beta fold hydrolase n=1 Tax=Pseudomonas sp. NPDC088368 TaxID=3364453 RepID=UPI00380209A7
MRSEFFTWATYLTLLLTLSVSPGAAFAQTEYRYVTLDGGKMFYREAGDLRNPTILLLHGFPSSSHMFRDLIPELAAHFHVLAPDYPGMGNSDAPASGDHPLTFDVLAETVDTFVRRMGIGSAVIYMQDFGGPVGMRIATLHPDWVRGLVIQNTPMTLDGWQPARLQAIQAASILKPVEKRDAAQARVSVATDLFLYRHGARDPGTLNPDAWVNDALALSDPDKRRAMTDLQLDILSNLALYPKWQAYLRASHPPTLVVWGDGDPIFAPRGADAIKDILPSAEIVHYNTGHFALEEDHLDIAKRINNKFGHSSQ